jgi:antirestriction protein ArdC
LINSQRPDATQVAGFHTWHDLGRWVKKGEKGIMIFAPVLVKQKDAASAGKEAAKADEVFRLTGFRTAYVFDASQTEGRPLPEFAKTTGDTREYGEKLKTLVAKQGISVEYGARIAPAQGVSSGGRIRLMPGMQPAEEFSVLAHELSHEMLHDRKEATPLPKVSGRPKPRPSLSSFAGVSASKPIQPPPTTSHSTMATRRHWPSRFP